ncbi:hypothetical protein C9J85_02485 [Haloferax sp. wsp5]|nr:hypothetical protein C9J85_02485 [Haloferax sp. wsp5]
MPPYEASRHVIGVFDIRDLEDANYDDFADLRVEDGSELHDPEERARLPNSATARRSTTTGRRLGRQPDRRVPRSATRDVPQRGAANSTPGAATAVTGLAPRTAAPVSPMRERRVLRAGAFGHQWQYWTGDGAATIRRKRWRRSATGDDSVAAVPAERPSTACEHQRLGRER